MVIDFSRIVASLDFDIPLLGELDTFQIASVALIVFLLVLSSFFSASETAYTGLSQVRLKAMDPDGNDRKVQRAIANYENFDKLLTTILVGNNIVNTASSAVCTALLISLWPEWGTLIATLLMITVLLIAGEITPKTIAKRNEEKFACRVAFPVYWAMIVLSPISKVFMGATKGITWAICRNGQMEEVPPSDSETTAMIDEILEEGTMEAQENALIRSAMQFDDKNVCDICVPRVDISAVSNDSTADEIRAAFVNTEFSRLPVYDGSIDRIIGYVSMKDFFLNEVSGNDDAVRLVHPLKFFPMMTSLDDVFRDMQKSQMQMAVVLDDYGGTYGMVTMEDLLEELVGEIYDESDEVERPIVPETDGTFTVSGDANIFEVMESLGQEFDCGEFGSVSVGGYISYRLGRIPHVGDEVRVGRVTITVKVFRSRRVREASFRIDPPA